MTDYNYVGMQYKPNGAGANVPLNTGTPQTNDDKESGWTMANLKEESFQMLADAGKLFGQIGKFMGSPQGAQLFGQLAQVVAPPNSALSQLGALGAGMATKQIETSYLEKMKAGQDITPKDTAGLSPETVMAGQQIYQQKLENELKASQLKLNEEELKTNRDLKTTELGIRLREQKFNENLAMGKLNQPEPQKYTPTTVVKNGVSIYGATELGSGEFKPFSQGYTDTKAPEGEGGGLTPKQIADQSLQYYQEAVTAARLKAYGTQNAFTKWDSKAAEKAWQIFEDELKIQYQKFVAAGKITPTQAEIEMSKAKVEQKTELDNMSINQKNEEFVQKQLLPGKGK